MKSTLSEILKDGRYKMACTFIVNCMGESEFFGRDQLSRLIRIWGMEEATVYFLNTREVVINIQ